VSMLHNLCLMVLLNHIPQALTPLEAERDPRH